MHRITRSLAVLFAATVATAAAPPASARPADGSPDDALVEKLEKTKVTVEYAPEDLVKVIDTLRSQHGLNVQVAWNVLDGAGIRKDKRVEIHLKDVPLTVFLDNLVREIDPNGEASLGWGIERGVILVTHRAALGKQSILRAYDIRDLIDSGYATRRFAVTPALTLSTTGREWVGGEEKKEAPGSGGGGGFGGGSGGGQIFGDPGDDVSTRMERIEGVYELIQAVVDPESWIDNGGESTLLSRDGVLFIRQTLQNHQRIREVLDLIRSTQPSTIAVDVAIVRLSPQRAAQIRGAAGAAFPVVDGEVAEQLAFGTNTEGVLFRSTIGGRNGEAAWISDVVQSDVLEARPAIVGDHSSATMPLLGQVHSGLEIIALPQLDVGSGLLSLDVAMAWKPEIAVDSAKDGNSVDRTTQRMRTVASQTRSKIGQAIALTIPATPSEAGASLESDDWVIVRVRAADVAGKPKG